MRSGARRSSPTLLRFLSITFEPSVAARRIGSHAATPGPRRDELVTSDPRRRDVRPTRDFYRDLYRHFAVERGPAGAPSRLDFELYELPRLFRDIADRWEDLFQPVPGRPDYRTFITVGVLVAALSVDAQLTRSGVIELLSLDVDTGPLGEAGSADEQT